MLRTAALRRLRTLLMGLVIWGGLLFGAAGRLSWARGWLLLTLCLLGLVVNAAVLLRFNPELIEERGRRHKGSKPFDKVVVRLYSLGYFITPWVAGLDAVRYGWSHFPASLAVVGVLLYLAGSLFVAWAMAVNPYLETTVRIQTERGHTVITRGPYRLVRHPFYLGSILQYLAAPLVLGSAWAFLPTAFLLGVIGIRTALEDATLRRELPGYTAYAVRTPFRLLPGIW